MGHEIITKEGERNRLQQELEERKQQEQDMVQPRINELSSDIEMYTSDISNKGKRLESCKTERTKLTENIESLKEEIYKLDKEVEELTKDANEKKSDPASYDQYKSLLTSINGKLSKEKSDLIFNAQEKDRKIREIKLRTEQIDSEKRKLDGVLKNNFNSEEELRQQLEAIVEEVKKKIDHKQT